MCGEQDVDKHILNVSLEELKSTKERQISTQKERTKKLKIQLA